MSADPIVRVLQDFSTCDVSDALQKLGHPHGGFLNDITLWSPQRQEGPTRIVGPAFTVTYVSKAESVDAPPAYNARSMGREVRMDASPKGHYIDTVPSTSIIFISAPARTINAVYGGLMSHRARYRSAVGTIVDGKVRDLQEHRDLGYPVFARGVGTAAPQGEVRVEEINVPVRLQCEEQDVTICPGDYLIGDLNGVVCLPQDLADRAIALLGSQAEADQNIAIDLMQGKSFQEASKEHRAHVKKAEDLERFQ